MRGHVVTQGVREPPHDPRAQRAVDPRAAPPEQDHVGRARGAQRRKLPSRQSTLVGNKYLRQSSQKRATCVRYVRRWPRVACSTARADLSMKTFPLAPPPWNTQMAVSSRFTRSARLPAGTRLLQWFHHCQTACAWSSARPRPRPHCSSRSPNRTALADHPPNSRRPLTPSSHYPTAPAAIAAARPPPPTHTKPAAPNSSRPRPQAARPLHATPRGLARATAAAPAQTAPALPKTNRETKNRRPQNRVRFSAPKLGPFFGPANAKQLVRAVFGPQNLVRFSNPYMARAPAAKSGPFFGRTNDK